MESDDRSLLQTFESNTILGLQKISAENQRQIDAADSLINNSAIQAIVDKFNIDNFAKNHPLADEIENGVKELIEENNKLKDTLKCNNASMIRHFAILERWLEEAHTNHKNYKKKLDEAKDVIAKLKAENNDLKKPIQEIARSLENKYVTEKNRLTLDNKLYRDKLSITQQKLCRLEQMSMSNSSEKEQEYCQIILNLTKQFDGSERARRNLSTEVDRFSAQETKLQQILSSGDQRNVTNLCFWNAVFPSVFTSSLHENELMENLKAYNEILCLQEPVLDNKSNQTEILSSDNLVNVAGSNDEEKSIEQLKEDIWKLRKLILQEQASCVVCKKLLQDARSKFKMIYQQSLAIIKEFDSKMRAQEITVVKAKEDAKEVISLSHKLSDKENRIIQLQSDLNLLKKRLEDAEKKNEEYYVLQSQIKVYEEDFIFERDARESLANEKLSLERNFNALKQRNRELVKQLRVSTEDGLNNLTAIEPLMNSTTQYTCFNETCKKSFTSEEELQTHVYSCLNLKD